MFCRLYVLTASSLGFQFGWSHDIARNFARLLIDPLQAYAVVHD